MNENHKKLFVIRIPTISLNIKLVFLCTTFILSCINSTLLVAWTIGVSLILLFLYRKVGAIEAFILLQLRSILNPGIAIGYTGIASIAKWGIVFTLSAYLLSGGKWKNTQIKNAGILVLLFSFVGIASAWFTSSYPVVATFKIIAYAVPFVALLKGVSETAYIDWLGKIIKPLGFLLFSSGFLINNSLGYLRNGYGFQGFLSHPNVYGVMIAVFLAGFLYKCKRVSAFNVIVIIAAMFLVIQSGSRTGMASTVIVILIYLLTFEMKLVFKVILIIAMCVAIGLLLVVGDAGTGPLSELVFKGHEGNLLFSRTGQIQKNITRFLTSPIVGTGFNVPYDSEIRSLLFSFDLVVENGNLVLALLGDVGILGFILFAVAYFKIYKIGKGLAATIFFVPFLVSMGEMSFFSTNNFAIILYLYFAIYVSEGMKYK